MEKRFNWRVCVLTSAVAMLGCLANFQAHAVGLGRITVQSALGEPLKAEIDIADINASEASSLRASVASADVFRAAGMEYSPSVSDLQISLQKRADGRFYFRLSSSRAVMEPFVDLVLEANWSSGRIVRDYTMLFDPPNLRQSSNASAVETIAAPVLTRPGMPATALVPALPRAASSSIASNPTRPPPAKTTARPQPVAKAPPPEVMPAEPKAVTASGQKFAVKPGDTAGKIAAQFKPASISLDQMLVALLRSNPNAFIGGNINRLKSGGVLDIPDADTAGAVSVTDASTTIVAQSRNFNDFRRKLAENIPATQVGSANREAGGKVQAKIEDKAPVAATPDKLTLSKGAVKAQVAAEDKIAKDRQAKEASERVAELTKNIGDLNKLSGAPAFGGAAAASAAKGVGIAVIKPDSAPAALSPASAAAPATTSASAVKPAPVALAAPLAPASAPTAALTALATTDTTSTMATLAAASVPVTAAAMPASAPVSAASQAASASPPEKAAAPATAVAEKAAVVAAPVSSPEPSLLDGLTENPLVLPGLAGLLLLLAGFGFYRLRQRNHPAQVDSSFLESRLQPDSFFGASGGQRVDTGNEGGATGSSLVYSPSQLDAAGDVDPVAEADVYLAYGRDLQAEEILKEALRTTPNRVAIYAKLMEIYAKRRDIKAFEVIAVQAFNLTGGEGPEWAYIGEMGHALDPANALYQPGGQPVATAADKGTAHALASAAAFSADTTPLTSPPQHKPASASTDFDLDLDFSIDDEPAPVTLVQPTLSAQPSEPTASFKPEPAASFNAMDMDMDMDFDMDMGTTKPVVTTPRTPLASVSSFDQKAADDALSASGLTFTNEPFAPASSTTVPAAAVMDHGMLEFDMGSLSLELDGPSTESPALAVESSAASSTEEPLGTKFALAEEFRALGDMDGARALAEEVLAQATGSLKSKAQAFLNALY
ncbi:MAG: fimbrial protein FimV [Polaromonas sp.]|nr:MAG: fimbrial protein FimV [Polaromonas sp.]